MAKPIEHVDGGDCYCLRCEAFGKQPDEGAAMIEARRQRLARREIERRRLAGIKADQRNQNPGHH